MLRPIREDEVETIRVWRNQPNTREMMNYRHVISPEEHAAWWEQTVADPARSWLMFELDGTPCGVVYFFDLEPGGGHPSGMWGFYLDNEGLAATGGSFIAWNRVMREAIDHAFDVLGLETLHAEVLAHNEAVRVTNRRFGFVEGPGQTREIDGRSVTAIPLSLHRSDRTTRRRSS